MQIHKHAKFNSVHLVTLELETGSAFVVFIEKSGNLFPIEIRISPLAARDFIIRDFKELSQMEVPDELPNRLSTNLIREISLSEVVAKIRSQRQMVKHASIPTRTEIALKMADENLLEQINRERIKFRNRRDLDAAMSRVEAAMIYSIELDKGSTKPIPEVAKELGITADRARSLIAGARRDGYLSTTHQGTAGGKLTIKVDEFWTLVMGEKK